MKKALLLGSYGQTNLGDDLLMYNLLDLLRRKGYSKQKAARISNAGARGGRRRGGRKRR